MYIVDSLLTLELWNEYTLKRSSNWSLYKTRYCATYLINASKVWLLCIVHTYLSINGKKKKVPCTKLSLRNGRWAKIGYVLGLLVHGNVVVEFGRKSIPRWLSIMKSID